MRELRELAKKLLEEGTVNVVIGWEEGPRGARPAFVTSPDDTERLVFDSRSVHNLATYLNPRRPQVRRLGRPAVVVKACDAASVAALIRETQLKREDVVLIGVRCGGVVERPDGPAELTPETVARRCMDCDKREPALCDHLVGEVQPAPPQGHPPQRVRQLGPPAPRVRQAGPLAVVRAAAVPGLEPAPTSTIPAPASPG